MTLNTLDHLELRGKKVLVRLDLNVPIKNGVILDESRILGALATLEKIFQETHRVAIMSHLGRPKGQVVAEYSLKPVGERLAALLKRDVIFVERYLEEPLAEVMDHMESHQVVLLENLRFHPGETKNDPAFARTIAEHFDVYVNDAFGTLHRAHSSVVKMAEIFPRQNRAAGLLIEREVHELSKLTKSVERPFTVVMGGAKVSDKIEVILSLLTRCNQLIIGGAMAYTFLKFKGIEVGRSRVEQDKLELVESIYRIAQERRVEIHLPIDHIAAKSFSEEEPPIAVPTAAIPSGLMGLDIGPETLRAYQNVIANSKTVLWNGPMGVFEWPAFAQGSLGIAQAMATCPGFTVIGGGDSVSCVNKAGVSDKMDHVSTGGGASLEFLEGKVLPGIRVLAK